MLKIRKGYNFIFIIVAVIIGSSTYSFSNPALRVPLKTEYDTMQKLMVGFEALPPLDYIVDKIKAKADDYKVARWSPIEKKGTQMVFWELINEWKEEKRWIFSDEKEEELAKDLRKLSDIEFMGIFANFLQSNKARGITSAKNISEFIEKILTIETPPLFLHIFFICCNDEISLREMAALTGKEDSISSEREGKVLMREFIYRWNKRDKQKEQKPSLNSIAQKLTNLFEDALQKNKIEDFYNTHNNYYMVIDNWPSLLEKAYVEFKEVSKILGNWCVIHNTKKGNVEKILQEGVKAGQIGLMIYDFKDIKSIERGLSFAAWHVMGRGTYGQVGRVDLDDIVAIIGDSKDKDIIRDVNFIQEKIDVDGYCWYEKWWGNRATARFSVDLSIDGIELNNISKAFVAEHIEIPDVYKPAVVNRLKQIAIVYIWMDRLSEGIKKFTSQENLREEMDLMNRTQKTVQEGI